MTPLLLVLLISCYDGDTCRFLIEGVNTPVRFYGIDAPEIGRRANCPAEEALAEKARERVLELLHAAREITLAPVHGKDKYGRGLKRVLADGRDVGQTLIAEHLAQPYFGRGPKPTWCP